MDDHIPLKNPADDGQRSLFDVAGRLADAVDAIRSEYLRKHRDPWVLAYSGGKDSTLLLQLTWEVLASLPAEDRRRKIHVVGNDTLVESPLVIRHLRTTMGDDPGGGRR